MLKSVNTLRSLGARTFGQQIALQRSYAKKSTGDGAHTFAIDSKKAYAFHVPHNYQGELGQPSGEVALNKQECLDLYRMMSLIRRFELVSDQQYKQRNIRGFCHLYSGQEAICVGMEKAITRQDAIITAYRDHGYQLCRGGSTESTMGELIGRANGCSKGKGGSMHMYLAESNFYGGNGIVGAQVPVGAGLAFALQYYAKVVNKTDLKNVSFSCYGDGAANQGQVFEAFNMAKLWNLPSIFVCENNKYGMGTSVQRSSGSTEYYKRGDYIPGIRVDAMDIFAVIDACRWAKEHAIKNGPLVMEMETYRYYGHSMSDPGVTYRSKDEIQEVRKHRDPIIRFKDRIVSAGLVTEDELKALDQDVKKEVDEAVEKTLASPLPDDSEIAKDILADEKYTCKGRTIYESYTN
ncbi:pyruvate dehydrogenase E1 alpha subunit [Acrasis kona]|uniref:Pyruvate dehydrogenase E1 component subunit alpha n=1 Tax=Acrasis kona TaxID=1008807 RepID=A0AAW2Z5I1_9EUKA